MFLNGRGRPRLGSTSVGFDLGRELVLLRARADDKEVFVFVRNPEIEKNILQSHNVNRLQETFATLIVPQLFRQTIT